MSQKPLSKNGNTNATPAPAKNGAPTLLPSNQSQADASIETSADASNADASNAAGTNSSAVETLAWSRVPAAEKAKLFKAYQVKTTALETAEAAWLAQRKQLVAEQSETVHAIAVAAKGETRFSLNGVTVSLRRRKNSEEYYFSRSNDSKIEVIDTSAT